MHSSSSKDRRTLKTVSLSSPEYRVPSHMLINGYIEQAIQFAGILPSISILDITNRTELLNLLDMAKRQDILKWRINYEATSIFKISCQNIKIHNYDLHENLLVRIPMHEIATVSYVRDDDHHIVVIKSVSAHSKEQFQLITFLCESKTSAEEICSIIDQCFQLIYTEATLQMFDSKLSGSLSSSISSSYTDRRNNTMAFVSQSTLDEFDIVSKSSLPLSLGSDISLQGQDYMSKVINEYLTLIRNELTENELKSFGNLLASLYSYPQKITFQDFSTQVYVLYGQKRKHLLTGMRSFIPESQSATFDAFLNKIGVCSTEEEIMPLKDVEKAAAMNAFVTATTIEKLWMQND